MFYVCCTLLYVHSSIAIILMEKRELVALLKLSSWCLVMVGRLFLAVPRGCLRFVIVVIPDHTHLLLPREQRICNHFNSLQTESEYLFVLVCTKYADIRLKYIKRYYYTWPTRQTFINLMSEHSKQ